MYGRKFNYNCQAIQVVGEGCYVSKESMEENMPPGHRPSYLCIEDPLVPGNDVGKSSYGAIQVQQAFDWAYSQLSRAVRKNCSVGTVLARIVQVDEETINYRTWIKLNHPLHHQEDDEDDDEEEEEEEEEEIPALLSCDRLDPDSDQASCRSSSPEVSHPQEAGEDSSPDCLEESGSSPGTGRSSPGVAPATPSSAMSISPANSEVGSRLINSNMGTGGGGGGGSQNSSTSSLPSRGSFNSKQRYSWGKNKKGIPDRADLDQNWRQTGSGPASDKSSSSSGSSEGRREKTVAESRADLDQNWRNHETPDLANNGNPVNALPPSGAKNRKNKSQKSNLERGGLL